MIIAKGNKCPVQRKTPKGWHYQKALKMPPLRGFSLNIVDAINLSIIISPLQGYAGYGFNQVNFILIQR